MPIKTRSGKNLTTSTPTTSRNQIAPENDTQDEAFLFQRTTQEEPDLPPLDLQTPTSQMDQLNLSGVLNQTIEGTTERMEALAIQPMETDTQERQSFPHEAELKQLKGLLTIIAKASHHKTFMEICLNKGEAPRAMVPQIKPHIYHTNQTTERLWRQTLQQASLNLVSTLINHHASIIRETTKSLRELEQEMRSKLEGQPERIETWKIKSQEALQAVNKLSEELKASRESKLNPTRKRTSQECGLDACPSSTKRVRHAEDVETIIRRVLSQPKNGNRPPRGAWKGRGRGKGRGGGRNRF